jgi:hypothetical protein
MPGDAGARFSDQQELRRTSFAQERLMQATPAGHPARPE